jgi:hypothetical protein
MDQSNYQSDRRKHGRTTQERRDLRTRLEGVWNETERARRAAEMREVHQDSQPATPPAPDAKVTGEHS